MLKTELKVKDQVINILNQKSDKLMDELKLLTKIVKSNRMHYKELEKYDFTELTQKVK